VVLSGVRGVKWTVCAHCTGRLGRLASMSEELSSKHVIVEAALGQCVAHHFAPFPHHAHVKRFQCGHVCMCMCVCMVFVCV
jgi:hypothetical protein